MALGANAIEPLPVVEFPTQFSMGYNGTDLFTGDHNLGLAFAARRSDTTRSLWMVIRPRMLPGFCRRHGRRA